MRLLFGVTCGVLAFGLGACRAPEAPAESLDTRTAVVLPPEAFEAVHAEMRMMLTSLHQVHLGAATRDTALVRRAAVASGLAAAADPALEPLLPAEFLRMAVATHSAFDSLAQAIGGGPPTDSVVAHLSRISANCVECHAAYRLSVGAPPRTP